MSTRKPKKPTNVVSLADYRLGRDVREREARALLVQIGRDVAHLSDLLPDTWSYRIGAVLGAVMMSGDENAG